MVYIAKSFIEPFLRADLENPGLNEPQRPVQSRPALKKCPMYTIWWNVPYDSTCHQPSKMAYCRFGGKSQGYSLAHHTVASLYTSKNTKNTKQNV